MTTTTENLARLLAFHEARYMLEPKHMWPDEDCCVAFAGKDYTQKDLAELVFSKYKDLLIAEAESILKSRTSVRQTK